jgi:hypothetical protein
MVLVPLVCTVAALPLLLLLLLLLVVVAVAAVEGGLLASWCFKSR